MIKRPDYFDEPRCPPTACPRGGSVQVSIWIHTALLCRASIEALSREAIMRMVY
jgi:hypothetical protein